ncbi:ribonucleotide-diphosphate reductase subunit beta [Thauera sp. Sel9]|uniref:ribonucleotide-diphosphate reductase subunit beta n=1 Tax=Thauera sp. Sel9 TaxID=2974299 RepID=UPI0021E1A014|nr:ribonucleotide-diphosphate reductase subunit beta [Thauera sp. Sel9]MCV2219668.1 ribonucleotide-diphosphate reductase subunit beta [Thauera sp. Sel9]
MSAFNFNDWDTPAPRTPSSAPAGAAPTSAAATTTTAATTAATAAAPEPRPGLDANAARNPAMLAPEARPGALAPVRVSDKRIVNGQGDINQLAPFKYPWAWEFFLNANKNHWTPLEISMAQDVHDYHHRLTPAERHVFENVLSYLTTSDILAMRNIGLAVMEKMTAPELQIYQARQVYEEALHTWTYQHCIESLGLDQQEIYNRYRVVPEIHGKIALANRRLERVMRADFDLGNRDNLHEFALSYLFFAAIFEGCWFYNGFSPIFALQRRGLMKGTAEQLQYIMRDEVLHCAFGIRAVRTLIAEEELELDPQAVSLLWQEAEAAEAAYSGYLLREPMLGYSAAQHMGQFRYIANRRARQLGLAEPFPGAENVLPWLDEQANLRKEKNFFETRVTEYQTGGALAWE